MEIDRLLEELRAEAKEDEVGLWLIIATLREEYEIKDPVQRRQLAMTVVQRLLDSGQVVAGHGPYGGTIATWKVSTAHVLERITSEWDLLGREPNIGEIVSFISASLLSGESDVPSC